MLIFQADVKKEAIQLLVSYSPKSGGRSLNPCAYFIKPLIVILYRILIRNCRHPTVSFQCMCKGAHLIFFFFFLLGGGVDARYARSEVSGAKFSSGKSKCRNIYSITFVYLKVLPAKTEKEAFSSIFFRTSYFQAIEEMH